MGYLRIKNGASMVREDNRYYKHEAMISLVIDKAKTGDLKSCANQEPRFVRFSPGFRPPSSDAADLKEEIGDQWD